MAMCGDNVINITNNLGDGTTDLFNQILLTLNRIEMNIAELNLKVDALQLALDAEQAQIALALAGLNQLVTDLQALVADGGTEPERQALADKLDVITADLAATIPDLPAEPV